MKKVLKPSDFLEFPYDSIFHNNETEIVAQNIMKILERTGNEFRPLTWHEYKEERQKDGNFTESEHYYFCDVITYCKSADTAQIFSKAWRKQ